MFLSGNFCLWSPRHFFVERAKEKSFRVFALCVYVYAKHRWGIFKMNFVNISVNLPYDQKKKANGELEARVRDLISHLKNLN